MSISLDGFVAGPSQTRDNPLGVGGLALHHWHLDEPLHPADARARDRLMEPRGAYVMGRNMFGPVRGPWDQEWRGWWGDEPPYHAPVFVLTHHAHEPIEMEGGTTFHFVTDGFDAAFERARAVAGDMDVDIAGGASTVRQALASGVIDELMLDIAPILLGAGERLFDGVEDPGLQPVEVIDLPWQRTSVTRSVTDTAGRVARSPDATERSRDWGRRPWWFESTRAHFSGNRGTLLKPRGGSMPPLDRPGMGRGALDRSIGSGPGAPRTRRAGL